MADQLSSPRTLTQVDFTYNSHGSACERIQELTIRLQSRLPHRKVAISDVEEKDATGEMLAELKRARAAAIEQAATTDPPASSRSAPSAPAQNSVAEVGAENYTRPSQEDLAKAQSSDEQEDLARSNSRRTPDKRAKERKDLLNLLEGLLPSLPSQKSKVKERVKYKQTQAGIATSQEWAALVLNSAADRDLGDLMSTIDLMLVC